jgi:hypothetical protein
VDAERLAFRWSPGVYLTDGAFLLRLVGSVAGGRDDVVALEDCYSLDVVRVSVKDLRERRLRLVTRDRAMVEALAAREA